MSRDPAPADAELHAFADGRLPPERRAEIEARLAVDPDAAERVAFYRRLNDGLHRLYDPMLEAAEPVVLPLPRRSRWLQPLGRVAAALALVVLGAGGGWLAHERLYGAAGDAGPELPRLAASAHLVYAAEVRHPVEVGADQEEHLVNWLSKRLGARVTAPDLNRFDYRLVGGRLLPAGDGIAGQFMYENPSGVRLTLFMATGLKPHETAFRYAEEAGLSVFYWRDAGAGYALSAALPREQLLTLCNEVYAQLNPDSPESRW